MSEQTRYEYSGFISYSHKDKAAAKKLQASLEKYSIPTKLLPEQSPKRFKVFRDDTDIRLGRLGNVLHQNIDSSRKLIVLCSPNSADSASWVTREARHFIESGRADDIIPVIISGVPNDATGANECFPEALRQLPDEEQCLAVDMQKMTYRNAFLRVVAGLLEIKPDLLIERDKKRRRLRLISFAAVAAAIVLAYAITVSSLALRINDQRVLAQTNELNLLRQSSANAVFGGDRLAGMRYALNAVDVYGRLYPNGDANALGALHRTLENSAYSQGFQLLAPIKNNSRSVGDAVFSPDDRYILANLGGYCAALIDADSGEILFSATRARAYQDNNLAYVEFSPSGEYFVTVFGLNSCEIVVWKTSATPTELASYAVDENFVSATFLSDDELIFGRLPTFPGDALTVWSFKTGKTRASSSSEEAERLNGAFADGSRTTPESSDGAGKYIYKEGGAAENSLSVFDKATGGAVAEIDGVTIMLGASHDGKRVVFGNLRGFCGIFSTPESATATVSASFSEQVYQYPSWFEMNPSETLLLNSTHLYSPELYPAGQKYMLNEPSGRFYAVIYPDSFVEVWDTELNKEYAAYVMSEHVGLISKALMTENYLVTAGYDGRLMIFSLREGALKNSISIPDGIASANLNTAGTKAVVVAGNLKSAYVLDLETLFRLYRLDAEPDAELDYASCGFTQDGTSVVVAESNGRYIIGKIFGDTDELINYAKGEIHYK